MKKVVCIMLFLSLFFWPFKVNAVNIDTLTISGTKKAKTSEEVTISLQAPTSNYKTTEGIWIVYTELIYDNSKLILTEVASPGYDTYYIHTATETMLVSEVISNSGISDMCIEGILHCGTYNLTLTFQVKNISEESTTEIIVNEFAPGILDVIEDREYTLDDLIETSYSEKLSHEVYLEPKSDSTPIEEPTVKIPEPPKKDQTIKKPEKEEPAYKSNNNYLKSLEITGYKIEFNKNTKEYTIDLADDVSVLKIKPIVENNTASYKITDNENLQNGSVVKITVTADNGETREYKIKIKKVVPVVVNDDEQEKEEQVQEESDELFKKGLLFVGIGLGILFIIGFIFIIDSIINNRKIKKMMKDNL